MTLLLLINKINICKKGSTKLFYGKNSFISILLKEQEENKENNESVEFQVVSFTNKIRRLTSHLELHKKDYLSQRGVQKTLGKRQRLRAYLSKQIERVIKN